MGVAACAEKEKMGKALATIASVLMLASTLRQVVDRTNEWFTLVYSEE